MHPLLTPSLMLRPPHGSDTTDPTAWKVQAFTNVSTAAIDLFPWLVGASDDDKVFGIFVPSEDCYVRFGPNQPGAGYTLGPAIAGDMQLRKDKVYQWLMFAPLDRFMRVIRGAAGFNGNLEFYISSRVG